VDHHDIKPSDDTDQSKVKEEPEEVIDAFGTLTISSGGVSTFFGQTAGSEFLIEASRELFSQHVLILLFQKNDSDTEDDRGKERLPQAGPDSLPENLSHLAFSLPFSTLTTNPDNIRRQLHAYLPPFDQALNLCQTFYDNGSWM